jgi:hypothetical protein
LQLTLRRDEKRENDYAKTTITKKCKYNEFLSRFELRNFPRRAAGEERGVDLRAGRPSAPAVLLQRGRQLGLDAVPGLLQEVDIDDVPLFLPSRGADRGRGFTAPRTFRSGG